MAKTVFVRNLPFSTTDEQLQELFKDAGEIKRSYVVRDRGVRDKCRGFGYVTFTTQELAESAVKQSIKMKGRLINLSLADKRPLKKRSRDVASESISSVAKRQKSQSKPPSDVGRTVVLKNLAESVTKKQIYKKCKKFGEIEETQFPVENRDDGTAIVKYLKHKDARICIRDLNGHVFKGKSVAAVLASKEGKEPSRASLLKSRLIVRNLSFRCSEAELLETFSKYGNVVEVSIPVRKGSDGIRIGCAFVQFTNVFEAARAMKYVNATEIDGRTVAVDWALPKDRYRAAMADKHAGSEDPSDVESMSEESDRSVVRQDEDEEEEESDAESDENGSTEEENKQPDVSTVSKKLSVKHYQPDDASEGRTVFVRSLPFDVDQSTVKDLFSQYGDLRYCRLIVDPRTGLPRGTAFIQYKEQSGFDYCLAESNLTLDGRKLEVMKAITPSQAKDISKQASKLKEKKHEDKRNLYLAKEGLILPGSAAANELSKADLAKRHKAETEKRSKLKNPNFIVSTTRLCVRNIPLSVNDSQLKGLFAKAGGVPKSGVLQVKVLRNPDRMDSSGIARSRGFAFIEFRDHQAALKALRHTNNNPDCFGPDRRLIVEFALENQQVLKSRHQKMSRQKRLPPKTRQQLKGIQKKTTVDKIDSVSEGSEKVSNSRKKKSEKRKEMALSGVSGKKLNGKQLKGGNNRQTAMQRPQRQERVRLRRNDRTGSTEKKKKIKIKVDRDEESFSKMVENYKTKLFGKDALMDRSRWFE
ncbi:uncharacterized protein LOC134180824 [Corticium candelabrum]|uniref:uncharacterized protein LOC134180824 n=1 Tax=Corticium candelabrum TaxID=121492 RepID=UPI002E273AC8|nr:uncharacterized protein LOC134180824 [Corticium candelabrum]